MKKLMMVVAILALVLVMAAPAIAQVQQGLGQESQTGNFSADFTATQSGDNSNQCIVPLQFGNTGSLQNAQGLLQYSADNGNNNRHGNNDHHLRVPLISFGGVDQQGSLITFGPDLTVNCDQQVQQSAAASSPYAPQYASQYSG